jgi:hypothetical protein
MYRLYSGIFGSLYEESVTLEMESTLKLEILSFNSFALWSEFIWYFKKVNEKYSLNSWPTPFALFNSSVKIY